MLKSMTGYGRSEAKDSKYGEFFVEIQAVNRKFFDININLPKHLLMLESKVRDIVVQYVTRGRINVFVGQKKAYKAQDLEINIDLVKEYFKTLKKIKTELRLKGDIGIELLSGLKDIMVVSEPYTEPSKIWPSIDKALKSAIKQFQLMREKEGSAILKQIEESLKDIEKRVLEIQEILPKLSENFKNKLQNRLKEIGISISQSDERVQKEVAIIAEHVDVTEEIHRMKSHISQFRDLMKKNEPIGKTIDFLIQELMREINTMGNKAAHEDISKHVIYIKSELEKIREQIQNIE